MHFIVRVSVMSDCTNSARVCLKWYSSLQNSDKPFTALTVIAINNYETQLNNMKSTIYSL